jgi:hypothetical protein
LRSTCMRIRKIFMIWTKNLLIHTNLKFLIKYICAGERTFPSLKKFLYGLHPLRLKLFSLKFKIPIKGTSNFCVALLYLARTYFQNKI